MHLCDTYVWLLSFVFVCVNRVLSMYVYFISNVRIGKFNLSEDKTLPQFKTVK